MHRREKTKITVICDEELLGKKFEENGMQLEVSERFYKERKINDNEAVSAMEEATILNITGKSIVKLAIENKIIKKENIIYIEGIPHAEAA